MILEFKNVSYTYEKAEKKALNNISFHIRKGEIAALIGPNGAGKTTTILNITRNLKYQEGSILMDGISIDKIRDEDFRVAYIPDTPVYYEELTILEHLRFVKSLYPTEKNSIEALVSRLNLDEHLNKTPGMLSKGTLQKLMISMALLRNYNLLIADEPFNGLDPSQIREFKDILKECKEQRKSILLSTHLLELVDGMCDKYIFIEDGEILAEGTKEDICRRKGLNVNMKLEDIYKNLMR